MAEKKRTGLKPRKKRERRVRAWAVLYHNYPFHDIFGSGDERSAIYDKKKDAFYDAQYMKERCPSISISVIPFEIIVSLPSKKARGK